MVQSSGDTKFFQAFINDKRVITNFSEFGEWYYLACSWKSSSGIISLYLDGELKGTENQNTLSDPNNWAYIGKYGGIYDNYINGHIDEVRISNTARSSEWISTGYNNQNDPSGFLIFGPEET